MSEGESDSCRLILFRKDRVASVHSVQVLLNGLVVGGVLHQGELCVEGVPLGVWTVRCGSGDSGDSGDSTADSHQGVQIDAWEREKTHYFKIKAHVGLMHPSFRVAPSTGLKYEKVRPSLSFHEVARYNQHPVHVYRILMAEEWAALEASPSKLYHGSALDKKDKFIHLSTKGQVTGTVNAYFEGQSIVIVEFRTESFGLLLKFEPSAGPVFRGTELFPHLHADSLDCSLATRVITTLSDL